MFIQIFLLNYFVCKNTEYLHAIYYLFYISSGLVYTVLTAGIPGYKFNSYVVPENLPKEKKLN